MSRYNTSYLSRVPCWPATQSAVCLDCMGLAGPLSVVRNKACSPVILYVVLVHVRSPELSQSDRFAYEIILHSLRQQALGEGRSLTL